MPKKKYYAVREGKVTGIFESWDDCKKEAVDGFSNPVYKGFVTREEAEAYLSGENIYLAQVHKDIEAGYVVAYTDGSYCDETGEYAYGICLFDLEANEVDLCGKISFDAFKSSRNISGELIGVLTALDWAVSNGHEKIRIYHDLEGISKWASGEYKANSDIAKFYVKQLEERYLGIIEYEFIKVPGHSNNPYNERADILAASALRGERKLIQGANSFTIGNFEIADLNDILQLIKEDHDEIQVDRKAILGGEQIKIKLHGESAMIKIYNNNKLLVQGKPNAIYQILVTYFSELVGAERTVALVKRAYRMRINVEDVDANFSNLCPNLPDKYSTSIVTLIRQAIINLNGYFEAEEYGQYAYPVLRAMEGHIKYLFSLNGVNVANRFEQFDFDHATNRYFLRPSLSIGNPDHDNIELCYNFYSTTRHKIFHFGDIIGQTDNTYLINTKEEADEIIREALRLINLSVH